MAAVPRTPTTISPASAIMPKPTIGGIAHGGCTRRSRDGLPTHSIFSPAVSSFSTQARNGAGISSSANVSGLGGSSSTGGRTSAAVMRRSSLVCWPGPALGRVRSRIASGWPNVFEIARMIAPFPRRSPNFRSCENIGRDPCLRKSVAASRFRRHFGSVQSETQDKEGRKQGIQEEDTERRSRNLCLVFSWIPCFLASLILPFERHRSDDIEIDKGHATTK